MWGGPTPKIFKNFLVRFVKVSLGKVKKNFGGTFEIRENLKTFYDSPPKKIGGGVSHPPKDFGSWAQMFRKTKRYNEIQKDLGKAPWSSG